MAVLLALAAASCGDGTDSAGPTSTTASAPLAPDESATTGTSGASTGTSLPPYGSACPPGSHRDCIDPEEDGQYEYLKGGADCMKEFGDDLGLCSDLDGDGVAGYPDAS